MRGIENTAIAATAPVASAATADVASAAIADVAMHEGGATLAIEETPVLASAAAADVFMYEVEGEATSPSSRTFWPTSSVASPASPASPASEGGAPLHRPRLRVEQPAGAAADLSAAPVTPEQLVPPLISPLFQLRLPLISQLLH